MLCNMNFAIVHLLFMFVGDSLHTMCCLKPTIIEMEFMCNE
jgi:hypothetical protein